MVARKWLVAALIGLSAVPAIAQRGSVRDFSFPRDSWKYGLLYADCVFVGRVTDVSHSFVEPEDLAAGGRFQRTVGRLERFSVVTVYVEKVLRGRVAVDQEVSVWVGMARADLKYDFQVGDRRLVLAMEDSGLKQGSYFLYDVANGSFLETKDGWYHAGATIGRSLEEMTGIVESVSAEGLRQDADVIVVAQVIGISDRDDYTEVIEFRVTETLKGNVESDRIRVRIPISYHLSNRERTQRIKSPNVGESYCLFLARGDAEYRPVGGPHGFLEVVGGDLIYERRSKRAFTKEGLARMIKRWDESE